MDTIEQFGQTYSKTESTPSISETNSVNLAQTTGIASVLFTMLGSPAFAGHDYLSANGKLTNPISIQVTETGGFVGVQRYSVDIDRDGQYTANYTIGNSPPRVMRGQLAPDALARLAKNLESNQLDQLPVRIVGAGRPAAGSADIPTIDVAIRWGNKQINARYVDGVVEAEPKASQILKVNNVLKAMRSTTTRR